MKKIFLIIIFFQIVLLESFYLNATNSIVSTTKNNNEPIDAIIILDRSGSMSSNDPQKIVLPATGFIIEQLEFSNPSNRISVITFSNKASVLGMEEIKNLKNVLNNNFGYWIELLELAEGTKNNFKYIRKTKQKKLKNIVLNQLKPKGYTTLSKSFQLALNIFEKNKLQNKRKKIIILITDGSPIPFLDTNDEELINLIGRDLLQKVYNSTLNSKSHSFATLIDHDPDAKKLETKYKEHLIQDFSEKLRKNYITLIPIAFQLESEGRNFLKMLSEEVNGENLIKIANNKNLIDKLSDIVPRNPNNIFLKRIQIFTNGNEKEKKLDITVPDSTQKVRFFIFYPGNKKNSIPEIDFYQNENMITPDDSRFFFSKNKTILYQSSIIKKHGKLSMRIYSKNNIPKSSLFIDANTKIPITIDFIPKHPSIGDEVKAIIKLPKGTLVGKSNSEIKGLSENIFGEKHKINKVKKIKKNSLEVDLGKIYKPGRWKFKSLLNFKFGKNNVQKKIEKSLSIKNKIQLKNNVFFARRDSSLNKKEEGLAINIGVLGEERSIKDDNFEIKSLINKSVKVNLLFSKIPKYSNSDYQLEALGKPFIKVVPKNLTVPALRSVPFKIITELPDALPDIPDGLYKGKLVMVNGDEALDEIPVNVTINIPKIVFSSDEFSINYTPNTKDMLIKEFKPLKIWYPPDLKDKNFYYLKTIKLWNSTKHSTYAHIEITNPNGIVVEGNEEKGISNNINFILEKKNILLKGINSNTPCKLKVKIKLNRIKGTEGTYKNTILITSDGYRQSKAIIYVKVKYISKVILSTIYLLLALMIFYFCYKIVKHIFLFKDYINGKTIVLKKFGSLRREKEYNVSVKGDNIVTFQIDDENILKINDKTEELNKAGLRLNKRYEFFIPGLSKNIGFHITEDDSNVILKIVQSPINMRKSLLGLFILASIGCIFIYFSLHPYLPLQKFLHHFIN